MLENVRAHIEKLIALYEAEKAENERLRLELHTSEETVTALRKQIMELESQARTRSLSDAFTGGDNAAAKEKVEKLIREINKCISLMEEA